MARSTAEKKGKKATKEKPQAHLCPSPHKYRYKDCDGRHLCKTAHCTTPKNGKYKGYYFFCYVHLFPTERVAPDYRTKETTVVTFLQEKFPNVDWRWNKTIDGGCSKRRPDLLLDMGSHILIVDVDKNSHDVYDPICEEQRMGEIWNDVGHRPIVFVRFNPDKYKDEHGNNVPSPWGGKRANGAATLSKKWKSAWEARLEKLRETVENYMDSRNMEDKNYEMALRWYICTINNYVISNFCCLYSIHNHYLFQK